MRVLPQVTLFECNLLEGVMNDCGQEGWWGWPSSAIPDGLQPLSNVFNYLTECRLETAGFLFGLPLD
jgi:hypothetical protein